LNHRHADFQSVVAGSRSFIINHLQPLPALSPATPRHIHGTPNLSSTHSRHPRQRSPRSHCRHPPRVLQCNTWLPLPCESPTSWTRRSNGKAVPQASPRAILLGKPCAGSWQCQSFSVCARSWYDGLRPKGYTQTTMCFASLIGREGCSRFLGPDRRLDQPGRRVCRTPRGRADAS
jgi:hypothetical protein